MKQDDLNQQEINKLINSAFDQSPDYISALRAKFENRLLELDITTNQAGENLEIEYRTLNGILDGSLKRFDILSLIKIGHFLEIPDREMVELYVRIVSDKNHEDLEKSKKRTFILNNFDLPVLRSVGVIKTIRDFEQIEKEINSIFGLNSITEYNIEDTGAALSSTKIKPKNNKTRKYFKIKSRLIFDLIKNPNRYEKQSLIDYFPQIRWHSTDVDNGLLKVIKSLYELGVTVIFQPSMPSLQMRGATMAVNGKPCIVLTDFKKSYPTIWFALLHELFHILFDWDEILKKRYHLSDEESDLFVVRQKEDEANEFARDYLFSKEKMELVKDKINQKFFIREYSLDNKVHKSIIYWNYAFANTTEDNNLFAQFTAFLPSIEKLLKRLSNNLTHTTPAAEFASYYKNCIFNIN